VNSDEARKPPLAILPCVVIPTYLVELLNGGPGTAGEMEPLAIKLSNKLGVLEFLGEVVIRTKLYSSKKSGRFNK
jgi:hypothetical protein